MWLTLGAPEGLAVPVTLCKHDDGIAYQLRDLYTSYKW